MKNKIQAVPIEKLVAHPDNPNRMSKKVFAKLVRNIERTGRYEPIVVRPCPVTNCHSCESSPARDTLRRNPDTGEKAECDCYQILNGHHRVKALQQLGKKIVDVVVWDIDDKEADILLATLNRLSGSDVLDKKLALLNRLSRQMEIRTLAKLLPQSAKQINRLTKMKRPTMPANINRKSLASPLVFFLNPQQQEIVERALSLARKGSGEKTKAQKNAAALTYIAQCFVERVDNHPCHSEVQPKNLNVNVISDRDIRDSSLRSE